MQSPNQPKEKHEIAEAPQGTESPAEKAEKKVPESLLNSEKPDETGETIASKQPATMERKTTTTESAEKLDAQAETYKKHLAAYQDVLKDPELQASFPGVKEILDRLNEESLSTDAIFESAKIPPEKKAVILARHEQFLNKDVVHRCWEYIFSVIKPGMNAMVVTRADRSGAAHGHMQRIDLTDIYRDHLEKEWYFTGCITGKSVLLGPKKMRGGGEYYAGSVGAQRVTAPSPYGYLTQLQFDESAKDESQKRMVALVISVMERLRQLKDYKEYRPSKN